MAVVPRAKRFLASLPVVDKEGRPTPEFLRNLNSAVDIVNALAAVQAAADAAQGAAEAAQTAAETAQNAAEGAAGVGGAAAQEQSIQGSYPADFTGALVRANTNGVITIASHKRVYGNPELNPTVAVAGASIAATLLPGDIGRIYYDDPDRAGGVVTYQVTDDAAEAAQTGSRHSVGAVQIPDVGDKIGAHLKPPGYVEV